MLRYVGRRVLQAAISLVGVAIVVFVITQLLPGDTARQQAGQYASEEQIATLRHELGLDRSLIAQFGSYLGDLLHLDFGTSSRTRQPVAAELWERLPASLELSLGALLVALIIGLGVGILSARYPRSPLDAAGRTYTVLSSSMASFWLALLLVLAFCNKLTWFPSPVGRLPRGYDPPDHITGFYVLDSILTGSGAVLSQSARSLALPCIVLGVVAAPSIIKSVRSSTINALEADYTRTSRLFGYSSTSILFRDGLRNSLLPVLTTIGLVTGYLLGGNVVIEQIFSWPGIGQYAYQALQSHDINALRGFALLVGAMYVLINMVLDILYMVADPRVQAEVATA